MHLNKQEERRGEQQRAERAQKARTRPGYADSKPCSDMHSRAPPVGAAPRCHHPAPQVPPRRASASDAIASRPESSTHECESLDAYTSTCTCKYYSDVPEARTCIRTHLRMRGTFFKRVTNTHVDTSTYAYACFFMSCSCRRLHIRSNLRTFVIISVCIYICIRIRMHMHAHMHMHNTYISIHMHTHTHWHVYTRAHIYTHYTCIHTYNTILFICISIHSCIRCSYLQHVSILTHTRTRRAMHTHTPIHIHTRMHAYANTHTHANAHANTYTYTYTFA